MSQATSMRKRHRFNSRMTRIVLLISFIFFFGRFIYSSVGAWQHHQSKKEAQQSTLSVESPVQRWRLPSPLSQNITAPRCRMLLLFGIIKAADILSS